METQIELLVSQLSGLNNILKDNLVLLLEESDKNDELIRELIQFVEILSDGIKHKSTHPFLYSYLNLLLRNKVDISKTVNLLSNDLNVLNQIPKINKEVFILLTSNIKGRLRKLSPKDSEFQVLVSTLNRLGGNIPNDVINKICNLTK